MEATQGQGVNVILEMLANVNLGADLKVLAHGGVVAVIGSRGTVDINPRDLMMREASVVGVMGQSAFHIPHVISLSPSRRCDSCFFGMARRHT